MGRRLGSTWLAPLPKLGAITNLISLNPNVLGVLIPVAITMHVGVRGVPNRSVEILKTV
jgi:hypothetical protein